MEVSMTEYSLFELAEFWLRAEEPEDNFSDDVKAAFQLIWDVAFQAGVEEVGFKGRRLMGPYAKQKGGFKNGN